jgi:hypothetical protein
VKILKFFDADPGSGMKKFRSGIEVNRIRDKFFSIFLFQLFGEDDPDQNVSPDTEDPEAAGDQAGEVAAQREANGVSALYIHTWIHAASPVLHVEGCRTLLVSVVVGSLVVWSLSPMSLWLSTCPLFFMSSQL